MYLSLHGLGYRAAAGPDVVKSGEAHVLELLW